MMGLNVPWRFPSLSRSQPEARRGPGRAPDRRQTRTMTRTSCLGHQRHAGRRRGRARARPARVIIRASLSRD
jgi:hypothetical protein